MCVLQYWELLILDLKETKQNKTNNKQTKNKQKTNKQTSKQTKQKNKQTNKTKQPCFRVMPIHAISNWQWHQCDYEVVVLVHRELYCKIIAR